MAKLFRLQYYAIVFWSLLFTEFSVIAKESQNNEDESSKVGERIAIVFLDELLGRGQDLFIQSTFDKQLKYLKQTNPEYAAQLGQVSRNELVRDAAFVRDTGAAFRKPTGNAYLDLLAKYGISLPTKSKPQNASTTEENAVKTVAKQVVKRIFQSVSSALTPPAIVSKSKRRRVDVSDRRRQNIDDTSPIAGNLISRPPLPRHVRFALPPSPKPKTVDISRPLIFPPILRRPSDINSSEDSAAEDLTDKEQTLEEALSRRINVINRRAAYLLARRKQTHKNETLLPKSLQSIVGLIETTTQAFIPSLPTTQPTSTISVSDDLLTDESDFRLVQPRFVNYNFGGDSGRRVVLDERRRRRLPILSRWSEKRLSKRGRPLRSYRHPINNLARPEASPLISRRPSDALTRFNIRNRLTRLTNNKATINSPNNNINGADGAVTDLKHNNQYSDTQIRWPTNWLTGPTFGATHRTSTQNNDNNSGPNALPLLFG